MRVEAISKSSYYNKKTRLRQSVAKNIDNKNVNFKKIKNLTWTDCLIAGALSAVSVGAGIGWIVIKSIINDEVDKKPPKDGDN